MGGKVLVPTQEAVQKLTAARLAADVAGIDHHPGLYDANADLPTSDSATRMTNRSSLANAPVAVSTKYAPVLTRRSPVALPTRHADLDLRETAKSTCWFAAR